MSDRAWKACERRVAALFGSVRSGPLGKRDSDVIHARYTVEVKWRKALPKWALGCLKQAREGKTAAGKVPIAVLAGKGMDTADYLAVLRLADLVGELNKIETRKGSDATGNPESAQVG